jgi:hypothetical protein
MGIDMQNGELRRLISHIGTYDPDSHNLAVRIPAIGLHLRNGRQRRGY